MKKYLCKTSPSTLAFQLVLGLVFIAEFIIMGPKVFGAALVAFVVIFGTITAFGYGLYRTIKWAQSHCA